jgi:drug/metabolite transporter (DMT)-like permease
MGIFLSIITSFFFTAQNTAIKKLAVKSDTMLVSWSIAAFAAVIILPIFILVILWQGMPEIGNGFWLALLYKTPLMIVAYWYYVKAHKYGEMSLISPLLSLTPAIILLIAPFMIGQKASLGGMMGIGLIVVGSYALNFSHRTGGIFNPIKKLFQDRGARYMMVTASIWAVSSVTDVMGLRGIHGSNIQAGILWALASYIAISVGLAPFIIKKIKMLGFKEERKNLFLVGFFNGLTGIFQMTATTMILVAYVNAIKRFSMVLGVIVGAVVFKEKNFKERLAGSLIMLAGVVMIVLAK